MQTASRSLMAGYVPQDLPLEWLLDEGNLRLRIPAGQKPLRFSIWIPSGIHRDDRDPIGSTTDNQVFTPPSMMDPATDLTSSIMGGPARWPEVITTEAVIGADVGPFAVDILMAPETNPWLALTRFTGLDFFADGRIAVCSWDGDVWIVTPRQENQRQLLDWRRIATGLFQPLGLRIINDKIHLICRDQLTVLHDLNGNGEIDYYECFNNDHQVTEHFHEFAMGLQTDKAGNFYYAKSGCHGKPAVVPHHGTLLKVTRDGSRTQILANGFRAANGVCLSPDGSFLVSDQEGYWNPKNRINWVTLSESGEPKFYGNMLGYHHIADESDAAMEPPLCWITNDFDRSPAELLWVDSHLWGPLQGALLSLSYGYGKMFLVPFENVNGVTQGGMVELPLPTFPTGIMRGRFHPGDGQLYVCGMFAWAGNATHPGGLYRVRYTNQPLGLPVELKAFSWGVEITFSEPVDPESVDDLQNYSVQAWDLQRTASYGSQHINQRFWPVQATRLSSSGKTLRLKIPSIAPTWGMEVVYRLRSADGRILQGKIHNSIYQLRDNPSFESLH